MRSSKRNAFTQCLATAAAVLMLASCKDSVSPTESQPLGNIAGTWTGTFDPNELIDCSNNGPAQASFQQNGSAVVGTLDASKSGCGFTVSFQGTLQGNHLVGTVMGDGFSSGSGANATLSGATLHIAVFNTSGFNPQGQMHLHR